MRKNKAAAALAKLRWKNVSKADRVAFAKRIASQGAGRPRSRKKRCHCEAMTARRAAARGHHC